MHTKVREHTVLPQSATNQALAVMRKYTVCCSSKNYTNASTLAKARTRMDGRIPADCFARENLSTGSGIAPCSVLLADWCTAVDSFAIHSAALSFALAAAPALSAHAMHHTCDKNCSTIPQASEERRKWCV
jgi:hypothetical protein